MYEVVQGQIFNTYKIDLTSLYVSTLVEKKKKKKKKGKTNKYVAQYDGYGTMPVLLRRST